MATTVPASLAPAQISKVAARAAQLEKAKPIVAYWCNYYIVNQILAKQLHNADNEALTYTTTMMDKLEQFKSAQADEPAVTDDVAGKAYVEQFGLETFARADNTVRANKASRQTADTFAAAATFLELLQIWGAVEAEPAAKIKYAKYHALRIAKALKAGEDPNDSNPPTEEQQEALPELDPNDADVQALERGGRPRQPSVVEVPDEADKIQHNLARVSSIDQSLHPSRDPSAAPKARQPSIAEVPDEAHKLQARLAATSAVDESLHPSRAPSAPPPQEGVSPISQDPNAFYADADRAPVSPLEPQGERKPSVGGNYFPETPATIGQSDGAFDLEPTLPSAPSGFSAGGIVPPPAPAHKHGNPIQPGVDTSVSASSFSPTSASSRGHHGPLPPPPQQHVPPPIAGPPPFAPASPPIFPNPTQHAAPAAQPYIPPAAAPPAAEPPAWNPPPNVDEEAMLSAQKHCRWAISALNFEDVPTAVKELRGALRDLGGL
jgi:vacuolar protein sorting-associated protein VTA1